MRRLKDQPCKLACVWLAPASCIGRQPAARRSEAESRWHGVNEPVDMAPASCIGRQPAARRSEAES
ncbi:hypothetical protein, partial [Extibacter muris]